jgi:hypothetical protein
VAPFPKVWRGLPNKKAGYPDPTGKVSGRRIQEKPETPCGGGGQVCFVLPTWPGSYPDLKLPMCHPSFFSPARVAPSQVTAMLQPHHTFTWVGTSSRIKTISLCPPDVGNRLLSGCDARHRKLKGGANHPILQSKETEAQAAAAGTKRGRFVCRLT